MICNETKYTFQYKHKTENIVLHFEIPIPAQKYAQINLRKNISCIHRIACYIINVTHRLDIKSARSSTGLVDLLDDMMPP